jgi:hypothetical protein
MADRIRQEQFIPLIIEQVCQNLPHLFLKTDVPDLVGLSPSWTRLLLLI